MDPAFVLQLLGVAFIAGSLIGVMELRVRRAERIAKKAHLRIDQLTGDNWVSTGRYKQLEGDRNA